ncbi:hypothetical protein FBU30_002237 [Linnemannia zychae]|nr:hypothetical protein FBU30_002237 [Linnemannia zychae]
MTPAPSSSRNRRSATLTNIPPGPPPTPPGGHPGTYIQNFTQGHTVSNHSPHSSFSSHSGPMNNSYSTAPSSYAPPRASFSSSSRASPVTGPSGRSGRDREQDTWNDSAWRSIFDAALVKAQQAVQLDELQETTLAANLYAQAANDLGRVIPMCSSEKKKQSMLSIQAIYLDRVNQLRESALAKSGGSHPGASPAHSIVTNESNDSHNYRYSGSSSHNNMGYVDDHYQPQQYQPQHYQSHVQHQQQQQQQQVYQLPMHHQQPQHFQSPVLSPVQQYRQPVVLQQPMEPAPQSPQQQSSGLRIFGKKRSKTQPSQPPPEIAQQFQGQNYTFNQNNQANHNNYSHHRSQSNDYGYNEYSEPAGNYTIPVVSPPRAPSPPPPVPAIFMADPPQHSASSSTKNHQAEASSAAPQLAQEQPTKSSKWSLFGKKKSKSVSHPETSKSFTPPPEMVPSQVFTPHIDPEPTSTYYLQQQQQQQQSAYDQQQIVREEQQPHEQQTFQPQEEQVQEVNTQQQHEEVEVNAEYSKFKNPPQGDWYVESTPGTDSYEYDEFENPAHYFDEEDEEIDPYYIADTKGRAKAFEGEDSGSKDKDKKSKSKELSVVTEAKFRKPLTQKSSSYSQDQSFSPTFDFSQSEITNGLQAQLVDKEVSGEDRNDTRNKTTINSQENRQETSESVTPDEIVVEKEVKLASESVGNENNVDSSAVEGVNDSAVTEKTKTRRTWYGKKKKEKDPETEKEKQRQKELDRLDTVARLMDDALFGAPSKPKIDKVKLKEKSSVNSLDKPISHHSSSNEPVPVLPEVNFSDSHISTQHDKENTATLEKGESTIEEPYILPETMDPANSETGITTTTTGQDTTTTGHDATTTSHDTTTTDQDMNLTASDAPKRAMSRHFSIFKTRKNKETDVQPKTLEGLPLSPASTNDDSKSIHSQHTRKSSFSTDRKVEPTSAPVPVPTITRTKEKDIKKRDSDEYVPYEYQEEVEGPLMERVEVPENREIIGFVLPVEEVMDYTLEGNEEAALENWDSWVNQLESFERVLSDKGLKKEKAKKAKKNKEKSTEDHPLSPMNSNKANRSSIFGSFGRSDAFKSPNNTTLDLNQMDSRPLSMSTTHMDDLSSRPSFQSSRSGESEAPSQFLAAPQVKKRWWKRRDSNSFYRASNALSTADLDQDQHLSALLRSQSQVRSSDNLPLSHGMLSMPISLVETPETAVKEASKEAPAAMESVPAPDIKEEKAEVKEEKAEKAEQTQETKKKEKAEEKSEAEDDVAIAPMPKPKSKSNKPKLLPISTPLAELLKIQNAEELWQYVQQAKTYATNRMNKGDKRSAAIALKRGQALEARWQEILLEMASSDEDTDELLEDDDESSESSEEAPAPAIVTPPKKQTAKKADVQAPVDRDETKAEVTSVQSSAPINIQTSTTAPVQASTSASIAIPTSIATIKPVEEDDEDDEIENYAAHRRRNTINRSSITPDKYSKYKNTNKTAKSNVVASSQASATTEDNADAKSISSTKTTATTTSESELAGRLGPEATLEQMLESKNVEHVKYYIQRMKTDTVNKARNGSKFAALEGMKNVKVLQQHLADLLEPKVENEEKAIEEAPVVMMHTKSSSSPGEERMIIVQPTIQEEDEEEDEAEESAQAATKETKEETKAPIEKDE